jgi:hypothetical protein
MGSVIQCFLIRPTQKYRVTLRRYTAKLTCPTNDWCHNADIFTGEEEHPEAPVNGDMHPHDDPHWPVKCDQCGYVFVEEDAWQRNYELVYRTEEGWEYTLVSQDRMTNDKGLAAPPGAIWEAPWMGTGPDGKSYVVRTPGGDWHIDGDYNNGRWTRTGVAPNLTVTPSILIGQRKDGSWVYHGFLRSGVLVSCD